MSYDINILVLNQQAISVPLPFNSSIQVIDEFQEELRYYDKWSFMTKSNGVWYYLGRDDDGFFSGLSIITADYEIDSSKIPMPYWIKDDEDIKSNLLPLYVNEQFKEDFKKILNHLINLSPNKTLMFLARFQSHDEEVICGSLSLEEFWALHNQGKILFNVCYIIRD